LQSGNLSKSYFNYSFGIYDDWVLPSIFELRKIYEIRVQIGNLGGFYYWSSCENGAIYSLCKQFSQAYNPGQGIWSGFEYDDGKNSIKSVRAIRYF